MNNQTLSTDEYDALGHILGGARHDRFNACVGRNAKRLAALKLIAHGREGTVALTDKGQQLLFVRRCILALRALLADPAAAVAADVALFLGKKSHIAALAEGGYALTDKGRASLADIDAQLLRQS